MTIAQIVVGQGACVQPQYYGGGSNICSSVVGVIPHIQSAGTELVELANDKVIATAIVLELAVGGGQRVSAGYTRFDGAG